MRRKRAPRPPVEGGFAIDPGEPVYVIGVVSRLVKMPVWTLRLLEAEGLVRPKRTEGRTRLYSLQDVQRLMRIRHLYIEERVNCEGIRMILRLEAATGS